MASVEQVSGNRQAESDSVVTLETYKKFETITFPQSLDTSPKHKNYLIFHAVAHDQTKLGANLTHGSLKKKQSDFMDTPATIQNTIGMIRMFMPNMNENYSHDYGQSNTSIYSELATKVINNWGDLNKIAKESMGTVRDRVAQYVQSSDAVTQVSGMRQLQNHVSLYRGTSLREQTFHYVLRPKNEDDLRAIGEIIYNFRMHSAGIATKTTGGTDQSIGTVQVPPLWFIEERIKPSEGGNNRYIDTFMMGPAVITNVRVNKTPDQVYNSIAGTSGDPIAIELEISFKEVVPVYKEYWDQLRSNLGRVVGDKA